GAARLFGREPLLLGGGRPLCPEDLLALRGEPCQRRPRRLGGLGVRMQPLAEEALILLEFPPPAVEVVATDTDGLDPVPGARLLRPGSEHGVLRVLAALLEAVSGGGELPQPLLSGVPLCLRTLELCRGGVAVVLETADPSGELREASAELGAFGGRGSGPLS